MRTLLPAKPHAPLGVLIAAICAWTCGFPSGWANGASPIPLMGPVGRLEGAVWDPGGYGGTPALRFDGRRAAFTISPEQAAMGQTEIAVEVRIKTARLLHKQNIVIGQYEGPRSKENSWAVLLNNAGEPGFVLQSSGGTTYSLTAGAPLADDQWHLVKASYDRSAMRLSVDGREVATRALAAAKMTYPRQPVRIGRAAACSEADGADEGGFHGLIDDVRLYDRPTTAPDQPAAQFDFNEGRGESVRGLGGAGAMGFFGPREVQLVREGRPNITLVYGKEDAAAARRLQTELAKLLGAPPPLAEAGQILAPGTWRLASQWTSKNLLLLGNIHTNRAILPLYCRMLAGTSARYPGPSRYEIRTLFAPLHRTADMILVGGSDPAGLDAAVSRFLRMARLVMEHREGKMPPVVELGGQAGPDVLSRDPVYGEFGDRVSQFFWRGNLTAARFAYDMLLGQLKSSERGLWGFREGKHYESTRHYCALRQLIAGGILNGQERARVDQRLLQNALENTDRYQVRAVTSDSAAVSRSLDRHLLSSVLGQFVALEYLDHIGDVPAERQAEVREKHQRLRSHIDAFVGQGRFRADREGKEGLDCVSALADLYLRAGDERPVRDGLFRAMADYYIASVDNLGCQAGQDAYITSMPGQHFSETSGGLGLLAAAHLHRDGQYRWLRENLRGFSVYWGTRFRVEYPPETFSMPEQVKPTPPTRYVGLSVAPIEPWFEQELKEEGATEAIRPTRAPRQSLFSKAIFRDGCTPDDAYLMLQGINRGGADGYQGNAIVRFTELGSLLLFQNSERQSSWARSVVSTSRGGHDPQASACVMESRFSSPLVSAVSSVFPYDGGVAWRRSLFRRHGAYFVVLDEMTADSDDTYHFTCRWRSFHPGDSREGREFEAVDGMNGAVLRIVASQRVSQTVRQEGRDGAAEPTIWRQFKTARLRAGQSASFQNLIYANNNTVSRAFDIRRLAPEAVLVKGTCRGFEEIAALGTGKVSALDNASGDCRLWWLSDRGLAVAGARQVVLPACLRIESSGDWNLLLFPDDRPGFIQNPNPGAIEIAFDCRGDAAVSLDGRPAPGKTRVRLEPGDHPVAVTRLPVFFAGLKSELSRLWAKAAVPDMASVEPQPAPLPDPWREVWRYEGVLPPLQKHRTIKASAEPRTTIGDPAAWVDRVVYYRSEPNAGWDAGIEGAAVLDLRQEVAVDSLRLIGCLDSFKEGEMSFELVLSNDGFARDVRRLNFPSPQFDTHYAEMVSYMSTYRFPMYVLPVGQRARHVKIAGRWREKKAPIVFYEIEVVTQQRQQRAKVELFAEDFLGGGQRSLLVASDRQLTMLSPRGDRLWRRDLESPPVNVNAADVNSDGRREIIAFTVAEKMHVCNADGSLRFTHDVRQGDASSKSQLRPAFVGAWRPDQNGNLEYYFLPHVSYGRISPAPELKQFVTPSQGDRGGKYAFTVPDVTGDGREELAIVGRYGMGFGVLDSASDLPAGKLHYLAQHSLTGHSTPNMQLPQYFDGAVARTTDGKDRWLGVVALNPGGVNYFSAPQFSPVWRRFTHTTNTCHCLHDATGDGVPEVLVGREDGFVVQYALSDGAVISQTYAGGEVRAIAASGDRIVVGADQGLLLLDNHMRVVGLKPGAVQSLRLLQSPSAGPLLVAVALDTGTVAGMALDGEH